jgi:predicted amidohydrolase
MHQIASRHYAFEGRCFVLAAGSLIKSSALPRDLEQHPRTGPWALRGGSMIVAPDGSLIAGPVFEKEDIVSAQLDLSRVREESMTLDVSGHYSRPDSFEFRPIRRRRA